MFYIYIMVSPVNAYIESGSNIRWGIIKLWVYACLNDTLSCIVDDHYLIQMINFRLFMRYLASYPEVYTYVTSKYYCEF